MKELRIYYFGNGPEEELKVAGVKAYQITPEEFPYEIEVIASNLQIPWAIAISDDDRLFVTERPGTIRVIENGVLNPNPVITLGDNFASTGEGGLLGIALDPDFENNGYIYIYHTYFLGDRFYNRIVRLKEENNKAVVDKVLLDRIPGGQSHNGGRLKIGPDGKLYATTGDVGETGLAQDVNSLAGKILRLNLDGSIPEDNPIANSYVYSYGHRNPQGLAWGNKGQLYESEHGARALDEINLILPGANYGWPLIQGDKTLNQMQTPLIHSKEETWAPSGITFITQGPWQGLLAVATLRGQQLLTFAFDQEGTDVLELESWLWKQYGRLRDVVEGKEGTLYITTSNRDGRGQIKLGDDKVLRLTPKNK